MLRSTSPAPHHPIKRYHSGGFTLIELLVVIAIIALLAAILFPVFGRVRENARRSSCASNLKQIGIAIYQYTQDYDERIPINDCETVAYCNNQEQVLNFDDPGKFDTLTAIKPYTQNTQIFNCPSTPNSNPAPTTKYSTSYYGNGVIMRTYRAVAATDPLPDSSLYPGMKLNEMESKSRGPSELILMQEAPVRSSAFYMRPKFYGLGNGNKLLNIWHNWTVASGETISSIHLDGGNMLFVDGHVKWRAYRSLNSGEFGLVPQVVATSASYQDTVAQSGAIYVSELPY